MNFNFKQLTPYLTALLGFVLAAVLYFSPVLEGKKIYQNDIKHFIGMAKEVNDFRAEYDQEPYWTNSAFGGMPTYNLSAYYPHNYIKQLDTWLRFLPRPADYLFLYFLSFFVLMLSLKVEWRLAVLGALGFGFSTYFVIILGVGHNAKAHAIAYMPLVLAGILLVLRNKYWLGFVLTFIAMALEINASHPQMTYYLFFSVLILGMAYLWEAIRNKKAPEFAKKIGVLVVAVALAIGTNASSLMATKEYSQYSTRGKSELTINPDGSPKEVLDGLSRDYITTYSYGITETFNLFIPRFMGGGNGENVGEDSNIYDFLKTKTDPTQARGFAENAPMYWGQQPIVEAPAYIGAVFIFLCFLGIFLVKGKLKHWLVGTIVFSIVLSWGKNFGIVTDFFIDNVPLYNKFRAVSSIQVLAELAIPVLAILGLRAFFRKDSSEAEKEHALKRSWYITGGLATVFMLFGSFLFSFEGLRDQMYDQMLPGLLDAIIADRKAVMFEDSLRSLILVSLAAGLLRALLKKKLKPAGVVIGFAVLVLFDLVTVDRRYVNDDNFMAARTIDKPYTASQVDKQILQDKSYYRVANFSVDPLNDGSTSYFHKSIGGYHAAKMRRYQELFDFQIAQNNMETLNMLNTKYFIFNTEEGSLAAQINPNANGNAWFIQELKVVSNANTELLALDSLNTKTAAVIDKKQFNDQIATSYAIDSTAQIELTDYRANALTYASNSATDQFAVFSEIYYKDGWNAYVDGALVPHYRVNYVLRGMEVPAGTHKIEFKFEPKVIAKGTAVNLVSLVLFLLISGAWFFIAKKRKNVQKAAV